MAENNTVTREDVNVLLDAHNITLSDEAADQIVQDCNAVLQSDADDESAILEQLVSCTVYNEAANIALTDHAMEADDMRSSENTDFEELGDVEAEMDSLLDYSESLEDIHEAVLDFAETGQGAIAFDDDIFITKEDNGEYSVSVEADDREYSSEDWFTSAKDAVDAFIEAFQDELAPLDDVDLSDFLGDDIDERIGGLTSDLAEQFGIEEQDAAASDDEEKTWDVEVTWEDGTESTETVTADEFKELVDNDAAIDLNVVRGDADELNQAVDNDSDVEDKASDESRGKDDGCKGKIVLNVDYGGFGLSADAVQWLEDHGMSDERIEDIELGYEPEERMDPLLIECVETLGEDAASDDCAKLHVVEFDPTKEQPDEIEEYDGAESIHTIPVLNDAEIEKYVEKGDKEGLVDYIRSCGIPVASSEKDEDEKDAVDKDDEDMDKDQEDDADIDDFSDDWND